MISISSTDKTNLLSGEPKTLTLTFDSGTTLTNENILLEQMTITQTISDGQNFSLGSMFSSEFKTRIFNSNKTSLVGKWFKATYGVNGTSTKIQLGRFKVATETLTDDKLYKDIVAYDALHEVLKSNYADWHNGLTFPMTVKNYRDRFFSNVGITQVSATLPNDSQRIEKTFVAESYSGADALRYLSEITGCFGMINNVGNFKWITIKPTTNRSSIQALSADNVIMGSLKYEEFVTKPIACVHIREVEGDIGGSAGDITNGNTYYITGNPMCSGDSTSQLVTKATNILNNIKEISYTPASITCAGMPWLECGDVVSFATDRKTVTFPIFSRTMSGISALRDSYQANGSEQFVQNVNAQSITINQLKRKSAVITKTIEEVSTRMTEISTELGENYYTKTETESYVGQTANNITASVKEQLSDSETALKEYADSQVTMSADGIRTDVAYSINGKDELSSSRAFTGWDKRSSSYVSVSTLSDGYYDVASSYSANSYIYGVHKVVDCTKNVGSHIFRCDVQGTAYIRVVATGSSSVSWINSTSSYTKVTGTRTYQTSVSTSSTNKYVHIYIGTLAGVECHVKNPRLVFGAGTADLSTAMSSYIEQTATSISSKVASSTYNSKMTQLDNAISQRVTSDQMNTSINQKVSDGMATITLSVSAGQNSGESATIKLQAGGKERSSITLGSLVRVVDLANKSKKTTIGGGYIISSVLKLDGSSGGAGAGQISIYNGSGSNAKLIGRMNETGFVVKNTATNQVYVKMRSGSGDITGGVGSTQYGRIDFSQSSKLNNKVYHGLKLSGQIVRFDPGNYISVNGHIAASADVTVMTKFEKKGNGYAWTFNKFKFRGGICVHVGTTNVTQRSITAD